MFDVILVVHFSTKELSGKETEEEEERESDRLPLVRNQNAKDGINVIRLATELKKNP